MMKANRNLLLGLLGLLFLYHNPCYATTTSLRGPSVEGSKDESKLREILEEVMESVSALQKEVLSLQEENKQMKEQILQLEAASEDTLQQHERRLQNSCIVTDSRANGVLVIDGCNVHIRSGSGTTDRINSLGNLIVGYNEADAPHARTGSHNIIVGTAHDWRSHSGIVSGRSNDINGPATAIIGGHHNSVLGGGSTIIGGKSNLVRGDMAHISGGTNNEVIGLDAAVFGGVQNAASAQGSVVVGGRENAATAAFTTVVG